jgi:hypothetical protein
LCDHLPQLLVPILLHVQSDVLVLLAVLLVVMVVLVPMLLLLHQSHPSSSAAPAAAAGGGTYRVGRDPGWRAVPWCHGDELARHAGRRAGGTCWA